MRGPQMYPVPGQQAPDLAVFDGMALILQVFTATKTEHQQVEAGQQNQQEQCEPGARPSDHEVLRTFRGGRSGYV